MAKSEEVGYPAPAKVLLEVNPPFASGDLAPHAALPEEFRKRAAEIADSVAEVADQFRTRLASVMHAPVEKQWGVESVKIEFKVAVQAGAGVVIAKASTTATFSVTVTLLRPSEQL